jgi:hypothetical protein
MEDPVSERSVARKLLIREGQRVALVDPPEGGAAILGALPPGVRVESAASSAVDVAILFARDRAALAAAWPGLAGSLGDATVLWLCYPKRGHGVETDLTRDHGWAPVHAAGYDPVTQVAIDETWSALRWRRDPALRAAREARGARVGQD